MNGAAQKPIEGVSMQYTWIDADAEGTHRTQYFEIFGHPRMDTLIENTVLKVKNLEDDHVSHEEPDDLKYQRMMARQ